MEIPGIVKLLKTKMFGNIVSSAYREGKKFLYEEFQDIDDDLMISHAKAYIVKKYEEIEDELERDLFMDAFRDGVIIIGLVDDFIKSLNALKSKTGDPVHKDILDSLKELEEYKNTDLYKKISRNNNEIAKIIKDFHGYVTIKELKDRCHDEARGGKNYREYVISEDEIKIIEATKNNPLPNQIGHLLFDDRKNNDYYCDHEIKTDGEILKRLLVSTNRNSPRYDIIFEDGTIVCYKEGDIRIRPYNFKQVLRYTKLYFVKEFDELYETYKNSIEIYSKTKKSPTEQIGRQMILNSFVHILTILIDYEDIYTKKIIDDSKNDLIKIKEITKKYDL